MRVGSKSPGETDRTSSITHSLSQYPAQRTFMKQKTSAKQLVGLWFPAVNLTQMRRTYKLAACRALDNHIFNVLYTKHIKDIHRSESLPGRSRLIS
jgi:hypothetical protein